MRGLTTPGMDPPTSTAPEAWIHSVQVFDTSGKPRLLPNFGAGTPLKMAAFMAEPLAAAGVYGHPPKTRTYASTPKAHTSTFAEYRPATSISGAMYGGVPGTPSSSSATRELPHPPNLPRPSAWLAMCLRRTPGHDIDTDRVACKRRDSNNEMGCQLKQQQVSVPADGAFAARGNRCELGRVSLPIQRLIGQDEDYKHEKRRKSLRVALNVASRTWGSCGRLPKD